MKKKSCKIRCLGICIMLLCMMLLPVQAFAATKASIKLNKTSTTIYTSGTKTVQLNATVTGSNKKVTWTSSKPSVATVNSKGKVTAKKAGTTTITAKANGKTVKCYVTVKKKAAASVKTLKVNTTYSKYDMTGNEKADKFQVKETTDGVYSYYNVILNGKTVLKEEGFEIDVKRIELKNKKVYLAIIPYGSNYDIFDAAIYHYKSGKLYKDVDLYNMDAVGYHCSVSSVKASNNTIKVKYGVMSNTLSSIDFTYKYPYKNGKLKVTAQKCKLSGFFGNEIKSGSNRFTANKNITVVKSPTNTKKIATIKKGQKVKIDKIYLSASHKTHYYHVKLSNGKTGWIKGNKEYPFNPPFKVIYAG